MRCIYKSIFFLNGYLYSIERPTIIFNITYENRKIEIYVLHTSKAFNIPFETYSQEFF